MFTVIGMRRADMRVVEISAANSYQEAEAIKAQENAADYVYITIKRFRIAR